MRFGQKQKDCYKFIFIGEQIEQKSEFGGTYDKKNDNGIMYIYPELFTAKP